ncbi:phosphopeptide-binding protein [Intrasporangium oryzae NRRL B-24470]|uniref:Phosphopeptide-binding protein n=1 Tax=Intrasporangium oryzae NRRL B-24470 TaxID=1386089 RepID=W9GBR6_9MICO|nr:FHA domain-containing protein [Intrasporangium oryzae]EWT03646.1 phosphopeptide-binding protein [Intrasporangium oryzae NRRL B-24470]
MSAVCPNGHTSEAEDYCDTCGSPIDLAAQPAPQPAARPAAQPAAQPAAAPGPTPPSASGSSLDLGPAGPSVAAGSAGAPGAAAAAPAVLECPNCHTENAEGALFCEACGYDFTTGAMPRDPNAPAAGARAGAATGAATGAAAGPASGAPAGPPAATDFEWLAEVWIDPDWYQTQEPEDPCPSPGLPTIVPLRHTSVLLGRVSVSRNTHPEIDLSSDPGVSRRHAQLTTDGTRWFVEDLGSSNGTFVGPAAGPLPAQPIVVGPKTELEVDDRLYVGAWTRIVVRKATTDEVEAYA